MVGEVKSGWADSMLKIAKPSKKKAEVPVLGEYVVKRIKKEEIKEEQNSSSDDDSDQTSNSAKKLEKWSIGRQKPNPLDAPKERLLSKIATRGVVQLFNAVKKHQSPSTMTNVKKEFTSVDKNSFLEILSGNKVKDEEESD